MHSDSRTVSLFSHPTPWWRHDTSTAPQLTFPRSKAFELADVPEDALADVSELIEDDLSDLLTQAKSSRSTGAETHYWRVLQVLATRWYRPGRRPEGADDLSSELLAEWFAAAFFVEMQSNSLNLALSTCEAWETLAAQSGNPLMFHEAYSRLLMVIGIWNKQSPEVDLGPRVMGEAVSQSARWEEFINLTPSTEEALLYVDALDAYALAANIAGDSAAVQQLLDKRSEQPRTTFAPLRMVMNSDVLIAGYNITFGADSANRIAQSLEQLIARSTTTTDAFARAYRSYLQLGHLSVSRREHTIAHQCFAAAEELANAGGFWFLGLEAAASRCRIAAENEDWDLFHTLVMDLFPQTKRFTCSSFRLDIATVALERAEQLFDDAKSAMAASFGIAAIDPQVATIDELGLALRFSNALAKSTPDDAEQAIAVLVEFEADFPDGEHPLCGLIHHALAELYITTSQYSTALEYAVRAVNCLERKKDRHIPAEQQVLAWLTFAQAWGYSRWWRNPSSAVTYALAIAGAGNVTPPRTKIVELLDTKSQYMDVDWPTDPIVLDAAQMSACRGAAIKLLGHPELHFDSEVISLPGKKHFRIPVAPTGDIPEGLSDFIDFCLAARQRNDFVEMRRATSHFARHFAGKVDVNDTERFPSQTHWNEYFLFAFAAAMQLGADTQLEEVSERWRLQCSSTEPSLRTMIGQLIEAAWRLRKFTAAQDGGNQLRQIQRIGELLQSAVSSLFGMGPEVELSVVEKHQLAWAFLQAELAMRTLPSARIFHPYRELVDAIESLVDELSPACGQLRMHWAIEAQRLFHSFSPTSVYAPPTGTAGQILETIVFTPPGVPVLEVGRALLMQAEFSKDLAELRDGRFCAEASLKVFLRNQLYPDAMAAAQIFAWCVENPTHAARYLELAAPLFDLADEIGFSGKLLGLLRCKGRAHKALNQIEEYVNTLEYTANYAEEMRDLQAAAEIRFELALTYRSLEMLDTAYENLMQSTYLRQQLGQTSVVAQTMLQAALVLTQLDGSELQEEAYQVAEEALLILQIDGASLEVARGLYTNALISFDFQDYDRFQRYTKQLRHLYEQVKAVGNRIEVDVEELGTLVEYLDDLQEKWPEKQAAQLEPGPIDINDLDNDLAAYLGSASGSDSWLDELISELKTQEQEPTPEHFDDQSSDPDSDQGSQQEP